MTRDFYRRQIMRLAGLPYFSTLPDEALCELVDTLEEHCKSEDHAIQTISAVRNVARQVPSCAEIIDAAKEIAIAEPESQRVANPDCQICVGTGWRRIEQEGGNTGVCRCSCGGVPPGDRAQPMRGLRKRDSRSFATPGRVSAGDVEQAIEKGSV